MPLDQSKKNNAIWLSLLTGITLFIFKLVVGILTHSVAILSLAVDSLGDIFSSCFNLFFLKQSQKPADEDHPYGHGKFENFGAFLQSLILFGSSALLIKEAIQKLIRHESVSNPELGVVSIAICFIISWVVAKRVHAVGEESQSELLKAEAAHLSMDSYLYAIVIGSLIASRFGFTFFDPIACFVVAGYIGFIAVKVIKASFDVLTDKSLTPSENDIVKKIIQDHYPSVLGFDRLQSRRSGPKKFINFRLHLCKEMSLGKAHDILDHVEKEIESKISESEVMVHAEPLMEDCSKHEHELSPQHFTKSD